MPVTESDIREAVRSFYYDFTRVRSFHTRIEELAPFYDGARSGEYEVKFRELVEGQRGLMFGLRNLYVEVYDILTPAQQSEVFRWIVKATGELTEYKKNLGLPILIVIGSIVLTAATGTALVAWHRQISLQSKRLDYQESLLPLVKEGILPPDVLRPVVEPGFSQFLQALPLIALVVAGAMVLPHITKQWKDG